MNLVSKFEIGNRVVIDGDASIKAYVTAVEWRAPTVIRYEVS